MNDLNSILIEGYATDAPLLRDNNGRPQCFFEISTKHEHRQDGKTVAEYTLSRVEAWGALAEQATEHVTAGRRVRIVGRIKNDESGSLVLTLAEHIELPPGSNDQ